MRWLILVFAVSATLFTVEASFEDLQNVSKNVDSLIRSILDMLFIIPDNEPTKPENSEQGNVKPNEPNGGPADPESKPVKPAPESEKPDREPVKPDEASKGNSRQRRAIQNANTLIKSLAHVFLSNPNQRDRRSVKDFIWGKVTKAGNFVKTVFGNIISIFKKPDQQTSRQRRNLDELRKEDLDRLREIGQEIDILIGSLVSIIQSPSNQRGRRSVDDSKSVEACVSKGVKAVIKCVLHPGLEDDFESSESDESDCRPIRYSGEDGSEEDDYKNYAESRGIGKCIKKAVLELVACISKP